MEMKEFEVFKTVVDEKYPRINKYELDDGSTFFVEPNFYTQLLYAKEHFLEKFDQIINKMIEIVKRNRKIIFTADYEAPVVYLDDYYYREIDDVLGELKLTFDNKGNPHSDWKD